MSDLSEVRDKIDSGPRLQEAYDLPEDLVLEIIAAGSPYARFACTGIDAAFYELVENFKRRSAQPITVESIKVIGDLVEAVLHKAHANGEGAPYLNLAFFLLGHPNPLFPAELNYQRVLPAMWMLMPRLIEIRIENLLASEQETAGGV